MVLSKDGASGTVTQVLALFWMSDDGVGDLRCLDLCFDAAVAEGGKQLS